LDDEPFSSHARLRSAVKDSDVRSRYGSSQIVRDEIVDTERRPFLLFLNIARILLRRSLSLRPYERNTPSTTDVTQRLVVRESTLASTDVPKACRYTRRQRSIVLVATMARGGRHARVSRARQRSSEMAYNLRVIYAAAFRHGKFCKVSRVVYAFACNARMIGCCR